MRRPESGGGRPGLLLWLLEAAVVVGALLSRRPLQHPPRGVDPEDLSEGYEHGDMQPSVVLGAAAALVVILGIVLVAITIFEAGETGLPVNVSRPQDLIQGLQSTQAPTPPAPRLEAQSAQDFGPYRAAQEQKLNEYRWVDRQAGVVAIPIDRAMDVLAQEGLPVRPTPVTGPRDQGDRSPSSASSGRVGEAYP